MQTIKNWLLMPIILVLTSCSSQQTPTPPISELRHFVETGHTVQGNFLHFFDAYGGVKSLGHPITEEIIVDGWRVQYFEKGRLEYHPENDPAYRITAGWLGDLLHRRSPPIPSSYIPPENDPYRRYFAETGHTLSGDFLDYFDTHGGSVRFGWPISEPFLLDGRLAQDFQSARFFWTPDTSPPVTLEDIGRIHLQAIGLEQKTN